MEVTKVFFVEDTGRRRVHWGYSCKACDGHMRVDKGISANAAEVGWPDPKPAPIACDKCGAEAGFSSVGTSTIFRRPDTGEVIDDITKHPGACYDVAEGAWDRTNRKLRFGPDGRALRVVCPNGCTWDIDSRASNCTMPDDVEHRCWVRHGRPEDGTLHVDKNGLTCAAGAGSIMAGDYHGFLHDCQFVGC